MFPKSKLALGFLGSLLVFSAMTFAAEAPRTPPQSPRGIRRETRPLQSPGARADAPKHVEDEILVRFKNGTPLSRKTSAHALVSAATVKRFNIVNNLELVKLPPGVFVKEAVERYQKHPDVLYAEPNYIVHAIAVPNDAFFSQLWGLQNTGQSGGAVDADIDAPGAWDITTGSSSVVVAVIDTGIDYNHQDLSVNVWNNADCDNDGIDDDGNGYTDDCHGIDVANNDSNPMDDHNHGTHVAGTIGAAGNNGVGVVGVNWNVKIMACKFLDYSGSGYLSDALDCLEYVQIMKDRGVNIVATNNSWGGGGFSQALYDAIDTHRQRGILFIAAAGNAAADNDSALFYPASFYLPNVISVAATDRYDGLAYFSNFGRRTVHIGAPGHEILSTTIGNTYSTFSGTSMATPHVTGLAALLKAQDPTRDWRAIKNLILAGGENISSMTDTITQKRINAQGALTCSNSTVLSRLRPIGSTISGSIGAPIDLAALNIDCANPNGNVTVTVNPAGQVLTLLDDGLGSDQAAGDGIYSGQFIPSARGTFDLTFSNGDVVSVQVLENYAVAPAPFNYRTITGTNLNLSDDSSGEIFPPFPVLFGGGSFTQLFVNDNGTISFANIFPPPSYSNTTIANSAVYTLVAPFWDDLLALPGTAQNVWWAVSGTAPNRELVVEWRDIPNWNCPSTAVKFQVVFFEESSDILFNYADTVFGGGCVAWDGLIPDNGASATVGVQVSSTIGTQFSFNSPSLNNSTALLWTLAPPSSPDPAINVSPTSHDFGGVTVGTSADRNFTVKNIGGGTLGGNASTSAPFSIVAGGAYNLGPGQAQTVTVRFSPNSAGTFMGNVAFTGGGAVSRTVTGIGVSQYSLTVSKVGTNNGTVTSNPPGIVCGADCSEFYNSGMVVTLTAAPASGSLFAGWSGCDSALGTTCNVTMTADRTVTATFVTPLSIGTALPPSGEAGVFYNFDLPVSGGLPPYIVTLTKGAIPPGLGFGSPKITGTPTSAAKASFTVQVSDQLGASVIRAYKITILAALNIATTALKPGTSGKAYTGALKATGGAKPYNWTLAGGTLPLGLVLNSATGAITGIPAATGIFNLTFQVADPLGGVAQKPLTLTIN